MPELVSTPAATLDQVADHLHSLPLVERLTTEGLIPMSTAAKLYGDSRPGIKTHKATPTRHAAKGVLLADGTRLFLEAIRVNGQLRTTRAAVLRFFAAQQGGAASDTTPPPATRTQRKSAAQTADAELDKLGVSHGQRVLIAL